MKNNSDDSSELIKIKVSQRTLILLMVSLNAFSTPIMLSATNVALPTVSNYFSLSAVQLSWVPMAYLMSSAMFILIFGRMADLFGRKKIFLIGTFAVILSSLFTAIADNSMMLLSGRFLQGVSAAMLHATQMAIVTSVYPQQERGKAIGIVISAVYIGLALGPVLGGFAIDQFGWRMNFLLHIPLAIVVLIIGTNLVKEEWKGDPVPLDIPGAFLICTGITFLCIGITQLPNTLGLVLFVLFFVNAYLFVRYSLNTEFPIWDIKLFFQNSIFSRSCGASLIMYAATYANVVLVSLYLQELKGLSASEAGLIMTTQPITMALLSSVAGRMSDQIEPRILASAGMLVTSVGLFLLSGLTEQSSLSTIVVSLILTGIGFSLFSSPNTNAIMSAVDKKDYGAASGTVATMRVLGQLSSMILVAFAMSFIIGDRTISVETLPLLEDSIQLSFAIAAGICIPGVILSMLRGTMHNKV